MSWPYITIAVVVALALSGVSYSTGAALSVLVTTWPLLDGESLAAVAFAGLGGTLLFAGVRGAL
jgi:hypothetical protein